jgi:parallel beta-helix repeat protein
MNKMKLTYSFLSILVPIFIGIIPAKGNTYYFSSISGDDARSPAQAQQPGTPWRSLAKLDQIFARLGPGDSVLFKRGEAFYGSIVASQSGTAGSPIVFAAFGQGSDPIISGFSKLSGWKSGGNGIWQAPCQGCGLRVNMVTIAGTVQPMGRYPNSGYLKIQRHTANTAISDDNLAGGPDWTGADLVIRKNRFILDRNTIVSQQGSTLNYKGGAYYQPADRYGYFIQNDLRTLDQPGEWFYDPKARTMNVYFGAGQPPADVLASSVDTLVSIHNRQFLVFEGLEFAGANSEGFFLADASNITIDHCRIFFSGLDGIRTVRSGSLTFSNLGIAYSNNDGIDINGTGNLITDCRVTHTGTIPGMGNAEHSYIGIQIDGSNNTVQYNTVDTTGYVGIFFWHSNSTTVRNNSVDYFCFVKDDGGGIYTWSGDIDSAARRDAGIIGGNIVLNGVTASGGTDSAHASIADGIYLDENSSGVEISGNTIAHCTSGIFLQDAHEVTVKGNTLYDNGAQIELRHPLMTGTLRNNEIANNTAVAARSEQNLLVLSSAVSADVSPFADIHDNRYLRVGGDGAFFKTVVRQDNKNVQVKGGLNDWQSKYGKDVNSVQVSPGGIRFEYNAGKMAKGVSLDRAYKDAGGKVYQGQVRLEPFSSVILIPNG